MRITTCRSDVEFFWVRSCATAEDPAAPAHQLSFSSIMILIIFIFCKLLQLFSIVIRTLYVWFNLLPTNEKRNCISSFFLLASSSSRSLHAFWHGLMIFFPRFFPIYLHFLGPLQRPLRNEKVLRAKFNYTCTLISYWQIQSASMFFSLRENKVKLNVRKIYVICFFLFVFVGCQFKKKSTIFTYSWSTILFHA